MAGVAFSSPHLLALLRMHAFVVGTSTPNSLSKGTLLLLLPLPLQDSMGGVVYGVILRLKNVYSAAAVRARWSATHRK